MSGLQICLYLFTIRIELRGDRFAITKAQGDLVLGSAPLSRLCASRDDHPQLASSAIIRARSAELLPQLLVLGCCEDRTTCYILFTGDNL